MPITSMSSVWYPVADWERAKRFYADILGLRLDVCSDTAGWAVFYAGATDIPFFLVRKPTIENRAGGGVVSFDVTDIETMLQKIADFGCLVDANVQESDSVRIYTVYDPDGNALELSEPKGIRETP